MTEYYMTKLQQGLQYQDFIADLLIDSIGIPLSTYQSASYQYKGENRQGFEIKFDDRMKNTGNIYIEISEKSDPRNPYYVPSGIYRNDNTWLYLIGDYSVVYIFGKSILKLLHSANIYEIKQTITSTGFIINTTDADKYCIKKLIIDCKNK